MRIAKAYRTSVLHSFSPRGEKKSPASEEIVSDRLRGRRIALAKSNANSMYSSPSSSFSLPWLILPKIGRRRSKLSVIA
ncbi:hypothetical protein BHM03_00017515 [Ensete ventricosum]|nr:hypothetical protein BHM03_00017515 [Ensete ventricosum]